LIIRLGRGNPGIGSRVFRRRAAWIIFEKFAAEHHYLKAIEAAGSDDADKVAAQMRKMKINDFMTRDGWIREDGRVMREMYLEEVKSPAESKYPFDYFKILATIPAEQAFRPLKDGGCPLVHD